MLGIVNISCEILSEQQSVEYRKLIFWQTMTMVIGGIGVLINMLLITVFLSFSVFWMRYKVKYLKFGRILLNGERFSEF